MNQSDADVLSTLTILPTSNVMEIGGSVLPKRFVSGSELQHDSIVYGELGSVSSPILPYVTIIQPLGNVD